MLAIVRYCESSLYLYRFSFAVIQPIKKLLESSLRIPSVDDFSVSLEITICIDFEAMNGSGIWVNRPSWPER